MKTNYPESVEKIVNNYLERLEEYLQGLPGSDKEEFIKEIESHIYESYQNDATGDEIDRILGVLKKLGEPGDVYAKRAPEAIVKMGSIRKRPLYILGAILIAFFALPIGMGAVGVIIGIMGAIFGLLAAYFITAASFVLAGFLGIIFSIIKIAHPEFLDEAIIKLGGQVSHFLHPTLEGILGLIACLILTGLGVLMLYFGRNIFKGLKFLWNISVAKVKEIGIGKKPESQDAK
jgi:uncharacterized membrane protein